MMTFPPRIVPMFLALFWVAPTGSLAEPDVAAQGWSLRQKSERAGRAYAIYARPHAGSKYAEYRMEVPVDADPEDVLAALEHNMLDPDSYPANFERKLLRRDGSAIVTHDYIRVPFLADRDVIMRTEIGRDPETGFHVVRWHAVEGEGPAPTDGVVRMPSSRGSWTLAPHDGGTLAIYESHVELGGSLPASFVEAQMPREILLQAEALRRTMRERNLAQR